MVSRQGKQARFQVKSPMRYSLGQNLKENQKIRDTTQFLDGAGGGGGGGGLCIEMIKQLE